MKPEMELKIQAYLDGELSRWQARRVAAWINKDAEAKTLVSELNSAKCLLAGNEPEVTVPETREFYWSKIARAIEHAPQSAPEFNVWEMLVAWRKYLVPIAGTAAVIALALTIIPKSERSFAEVENLSEYTSSVSFHSQSGMFFVWVYEKNSAAESQPEFFDEDDITVQ